MFWRVLTWVSKAFLWVPNWSECSVPVRTWTKWHIHCGEYIYILRIKVDTVYDTEVISPYCGLVGDLVISQHILTFDQSHCVHTEHPPPVATPSLHKILLIHHYNKHCPSPSHPSIEKYSWCCRITAEQPELEVASSGLLFLVLFASSISIQPW